MVARQDPAARLDDRHRDPEAGEDLAELAAGTVLRLTRSLLPAMPQPLLKLADYFGAHTYRRTAFAGDYTGLEIQRKLLTLWNSVSFFASYANTSGFTPDVADLDVQEAAWPGQQPLDRWLIASGNRTPDQMEAFADQLLGEEWELPFDHPRPAVTVDCVVLGLDRDDMIVRRRLAQKMEFLAEDLSTVPEPTNAELETWFKQNASRLGGIRQCMCVSWPGHIKDQGALRKQIEKTLWDHAALRLTPHQFRHAAAKILLDARPGFYEVVRKLLGHKSMVTTYSHYAGAETQAAVELYADVITDHRRKGVARRLPQAANRAAARPATPGPQAPPAGTFSPP